MPLVRAAHATKGLKVTWGSITNPRPLHGHLETSPMANTKQITDRTERKNAKRGQRKALKSTYTNLSTKDRKAYVASETVGLRAWISEQESSEAEG